MNRLPSSLSRHRCEHMCKFDPEYRYEPFMETDPSKKITRYKRMCPYCGCVEGPEKTIIMEDNAGTVTCKNCMSVLAYFEIWDMGTQTLLSKSWCCKHPQQFRKGIGILDNRVTNPCTACKRVQEKVIHVKKCQCKEHCGVSIHMDKRCRYASPDKRAHAHYCHCTFSEASVDTVPGGFVFVNKYICFKCLTIVTRRTEDMDRNDVTWSRPFLDSLLLLSGRTMEGLNMPWFEDESSARALGLSGPKIKDKHPVLNVDKVDKYPLTIDEYMELPYLVNFHRDLQHFGALIIELNLIVHAASQDELVDKVKVEMKDWLQSKMDSKDHIPLPAGYEVHDGKVRRTPGTMGAAIPAQYQGFGKVGKK